MIDKPSQRTEQLFVGCAFAVYLIVQLHAAVFHGSWGQDWIGHKTWIAFAAAHPWDFLIHYQTGRTNPALYHLLGALVLRVVGISSYLSGIAVVNITLGFGGNCCAYFVIRRLITSPWLRMSALVFTLFLPAAMIHAQVMAADALATPIYCVLLWLAVRFPLAGSGKAFARSTAAMALLLIAGILVKFTFLSCVAAAAVWIFAMAWARRLSTRRLLLLAASVVIVPGLSGYFEMTRFTRGAGNVWSVVPITVDRLSNGEMNLGSVLGLRPADVDIFAAPPYNHFQNGEYDLLADNRHSFIALLHLGTFTDILNIYQPDPYDYYFGSRTWRSERRMQLAVRIGILASVLAIVGVAVLLVASTIQVLFKRDAQDSAIFTVLLFSMAWFSNLAVMLPFIPGAYASGYWLPRLYVPALLGFFIAAFVFLDRLILRWPRVQHRLQIVVLVYALAQSTLHVLFLWPVASGARLYEYNVDVDSSPNPVIWRAFNWQDNYGSNGTGEYWLDQTMGIAVNRPHHSAPETWAMNLTLTPGPAGVSPHRVVRISTRNASPTIVEFDSEKSVTLDLNLTEGRNDIRIDRVAPGQVAETLGDPLLRTVHVTSISFRRGDGARGVFSVQ